MAKIWKFGQVIMDSIRKYLRRMLISADEQEWNSYISTIKEILFSDPEKLTKLHKITSNPSYYAGYFLRKIEGNLLMLGSVPAEENHASIIVFLGKGNSGWSVVYHLAALLNRQAEYSKVKKREEDRLHVSTLKYMIKEFGQAGLEDTLAKKSVSMFAYFTLYVNAAKTSLNLQSCLASGEREVGI